ncbi:hypothetical protein DW742_16530 [Butyricicoccus sp. AM28-25]|nr:hypothetical protein [Butyricicoccus sp. AM28-25]RHT67519.1 hypothetical protein DW742_16530 [Butyricicoccus sp. AM28-25]
MAEYITKKAAIKAVENAPIELFQSEWEEIEEAINAAPAADVVPVVHGWWNADETCSLCGEKSTEGLDATKWNYWLPNYCPNCGAKMDGGTDND